MALTHAWHDLVHDMRDEMHDLATITRVDAARQAYLALWATFLAVPLVFGIDRFAAWLNEDWNALVATWANDLMPGSASDAVMVFGVVELALAAMVALMPRIGGYLLAGWFVLLALNVFAIDGLAWLGIGTLALAMASVAMARMSTAYHHTEG
jgi:hypothetical protein